MRKIACAIAVFAITFSCFLAYAADQGLLLHLEFGTTEVLMEGLSYSVLASALTLLLIDFITGIFNNRKRDEKTRLKQEKSPAKDGVPA